MKIDVIKKVANVSKEKLNPSKVKRNELPNFFRDEELFNPKKDKVTADYFKYSDNDYPVHVNEYDEAYDMFSMDKLNMFDKMI